MPGRVHAILVVRPDGRTPAAFHLRRTLAALSAQSRPVDALTIVVCGDDPIAAEAAASAPAESVITTPARTRFAEATAIASRRVAAGDAVWLLAQDTAPEPEALARLAGALELAPSVAFVAPKLVRADDRSVIVSLGMSVTQVGRAVGLADGELDQGQHDVREDVLGADVRGILVRGDAWHKLKGLDRALGGAEEGLDLGIRARLAGSRVTLVPNALVAVSGDGVAGPAAPTSRARRMHTAIAERTSQLHRRLAYAHPVALPFLWLAILPLALWRTIVLLVGKQPGLIAPEWAASAIVLVRLGAIARSRSRIRHARSATWAQLAPLRVGRSELRERLDDGPEVLGDVQRGELRFFAGGGAWLVLAALVVSVASFTALLAWPVLGGGALQPLRSVVAQLWTDAAYGARALGLDTVGPADPFAAVIAVLGSLWPLEPSRTVVILWILSLPLAALGGWFAATRVTDRPILRITGGAVWALAPTFLAALVEGRPAAVIAHLLLPWLFYAASVAHRSWVAAGAASVLLAGVVACAPSLAPALAVVWVVALSLTIARRAGRGVAQLVWVVIPTAALAAPLVWYQLRSGDAWGLLADPGVPWAGPQVAADPAGRALLAAGFPTSDPGGWGAFLDGGPTWWVPLLAAPIAVLALVAPVTQRWLSGVVLLVVAVLGIGTAFAAAAVSVAFDESLAVPVWPGAGVSLAWLGALGGALVALDSGLAPRLATVRSLVAVGVIAAIAVLAVPALTASVRGVTFLTNGPESTLPAYVAAEGRDDPDVGTLVLTPQNAGGLAADLVWGGSETLGGQATIVATRTSPTKADRTLANLSADLVTASAGDAVAQAAAEGIRFVLLAPAAEPESDAARSLRLSSQTALDQRDGLDAVGDTPKGSLWRVTIAVAGRAEASVGGLAGWIAFGQLAAFGVALLLAIPTSGARRAAQRTPRVVGHYWQEGR
ncbi:glycosyltransferase family 2 protein [Microbacterium sp. 4R-513]|uniref:glycosyltransferase n=1 Tax=Microbacterium sp. 4R-513 TaxID=2567934 RepID=UPI0013E1A7B7|nr:glycosyltransferase [Microbacterium sp. 4R-513]QIG38296.1 glycosyltransferase family 2 protein [Microbacterium sp. 4R-513]